MNLISRRQGRPNQARAKRCILALALGARVAAALQGSSLACCCVPQSMVPSFFYVCGPRSFPTHRLRSFCQLRARLPLSLLRPVHRRPGLYFLILLIELCRYIDTHPNNPRLPSTCRAWPREAARLPLVVSASIHLLYHGRGRVLDLATRSSPSAPTRYPQHAPMLVLSRCELSITIRKLLSIA